MKTLSRDEIVVVVGLSFGCFLCPDAARAADDVVDIVNDINETGAVLAESFGNRGAATVLRNLGNAGTGISIVQNVRQGDIPGVVGDLVEAGTAFWTVPAGIAGGGAVGGPPGAAIGGTIGVAVADIRGKQAEEATRRLLEKLGDKRSELQKRMDKVGLDHKAFADDFGDLRELGNLAKYEAELRKKLLQLEEERAVRNGESYMGDSFLEQEIYALEESVSAIEEAKLEFPYDQPEGTQPPCGPISQDEIDWIKANSDANIENVIKGLEGGKKNLANILARKNPYQPDVEVTRNSILYAENRIAGLLDKAREETGSCPPVVPPGCGGPSERDKQELEQLRNAVRQAEYQVEQGEEHHRLFPMIAYPGKDLLKVRDALRGAQQALATAESAASVSGNACGAKQPSSDNHVPQASPENLDRGGSGNKDYSSGASPASLPAGYRRVSPNACINSIGDVIRC